MECRAVNRLILISNRVQAPSEETGAQGGLAVALTAALRSTGGIWFGWSGEAGMTTDPRFVTYDGVTSATVDLPEQDVEEYYDGYANRTLWPLFHFRLDLTEIERDFEGGYERVNRVFSEVVGPCIKRGDLVWVHDYHMIPLGLFLRHRGLTNRMGFFLHIPWPPTSLLTALPHHRRLVDALFAYDVVGFQAREWLDAFLDYAVHELGGLVADDGSVTVDGRTIQTMVCPIGIDADEFIEGADSAEAASKFERMVESSNGRHLIVGVDRLDYSKGLEERFNGYQRYLETHPDAHSNVYLLQIAPPSRASIKSYKDIREKLDALSGRINGAFADIDWVPIRYVNQGYSRAVLSGIYRAAHVGLVTPLRDGMNLVAKEFIAAQDPEDPGVLILSRFAGAAEQLGGAILVNPYSPDDVADAIKRALAMPLEERKQRWQPMFDGIRQNDIKWWTAKFLDALTGAARDSAD